MQDHRHRHNSIKGMIMQVLPKLYTASSLIFFTLRGLGTQFLVIRQPLYFPKKIGLGELQNLWILCHQYYFNIQWSMMKFMIYSKWICGLRSARRGRSGLNRVGITNFILFFFFTFPFFSYPIILHLYLILHFFTFHLAGAVVKTDILWSGWPSANVKILTR